MTPQTSNDWWMRISQGEEVIMELGTTPPTQDVFWIVMRDPKTMNVTVRHDTLEAAKAEAERLCAKHNAPFYVCRIAVYGWYEPQAPEWTAA